MFRMEPLPFCFASSAPLEILLAAFFMDSFTLEDVLRMENDVEGRKMEGEFFLLLVLLPCWDGLGGAVTLFISFSLENKM